MLLKLMSPVLSDLKPLSKILTYSFGQIAIIFSSPSFNTLGTPAATSPGVGTFFYTILAPIELILKAFSFGAASWLVYGLIISKLFYLGRIGTALS